jgi:ubiquinone/menaquinone biosynthesis C-methylase UbiE
VTASERTSTIAHDEAIPLGAHLDVEKMPAHWLMARLGKRVLRPGGIETTRWLLEHASVTPRDEVIELAPGLGRTAALILSRQPKSYVGVERDTRAAQFAERALTDAGWRDAHVLHADAASVPLPDQAATLLVGEAMLSMQTATTKQAIIREAHRLLKPGGRYVIHELALMPDSIDPALFARIQSDLSSVIHVGVRIGTVREWKQWIEQAGFTIEQMTTAPMHLLDPARLIRDEGVAGAVRFVFNALRTPGAPRRLRSVRGVFRRYREHLCAIGVIARA